MKKIILSLILTLMLCISFTGVISFAENEYEADESITVYAGENINDVPDLVMSGVVYNSDYVVDNYGLLTTEEEEALEELIITYNDLHDVNIVILTENGLDGKTPMEYADDYYDYNNYAPNGILLLVSMAENDWYVSTTGTCIDAVTDAGLDAMSEDFVPYLSSGDYYEAFDVFVTECDDYLTQYENGTPYDIDTLPDYNYESEPGYIIYLKYLVIALAAGFLISLIPMSKLKNEMRTVNRKADAKDYMINGSMRITENSDMFLYRNVTRTPIPKQTSSGGGSSTHTGSSGTSHGGGGGKF